MHWLMNGAWTFRACYTVSASGLPSLSFSASTQTVPASAFGFIPSVYRVTENRQGIKKNRKITFGMEIHTHTHTHLEVMYKKALSVFCIFCFLAMSHMSSTIHYVSCNVTKRLVQPSQRFGQHLLVYHLFVPTQQGRSTSDILLFFFFLFLLYLYEMDTKETYFDNHSTIYVVQTIVLYTLT